MKKEELRRDPVREGIVNAVQYISENTRTVFQVIGAIIIAVAGISYYNHTDNIRMENASHIAGRAQNIFINGNLDEANVKFERVLIDYPNTLGATQSLVYLLNAAISNNDIAVIDELLSNNDISAEDPHLQAAFYKIQADVIHNKDDFTSAIKYYKRAQVIATSTQSQIGYQLNIASTFLAQNNYENAVQTLQKIIDNNDVGFNEKNIAEELLAYAKQKMRI